MSLMRFSSKYVLFSNWLSSTSFFIGVLSALLLAGCEKQTQEERYSLADAEQTLAMIASFDGTGAWLLAHRPELVCEAFDDSTPVGIRRFRNYSWTLPGTDPDAGMIVLVSHYDLKQGIAGFKGANDGGSSSALLLALTHIVTPGRHTVRFLWVDGEECLEHYTNDDGLHGSRFAASQLVAQKQRIEAVIVCDMVGDRDLVLTPPSNTTLRLVRLAERAAQISEGTTAQTLVQRSDRYIVDDHLPFLMAGFPVIDLIDFDFGPGNCYWHTPADTVDKLSAQSLKRTGDLVLTMIDLIEGRLQ